MPIRDNRIQLTDAEAIAPGGFPGEWVDDGGGTMTGSVDTATFVEGASSIAARISNSRVGLLWQEDADRDWSGNVFYIWFSSGVANKLAEKAGGGVTVRFTGATITDWFEVFIDGNDTYGGGFKMAVVDIDAARDLAVNATGSPAGDGATNGTPPATTAIRRVGIMFDVRSSAPGGADNHWIDAIWRLPAGTPGVVVSGTNIDVSPIRPYNWDDIVFAGLNTDPAKAWGVIEKADGVIKLNTPIQFGNAGSPDDGDHDFEDSLATVAWESQIVPDGFYGLTFVGDGVNTQRFVMGQNGSAGQGLAMLAASDGPRWFLDATDVNIESVGLYGCSFTHTSIIDIDNRFVDMYDSLLIDGQRLYHSRLASPRSGADFRRNAIINASPIYDVGSPAAIRSPANRAYCHSADLEKIIDCTWNYFDGHAIRLLEARDQDFVGNVFDQEWESGNSPDGQQTLEAGLLNEVGDLTISVSGGGNTPTYFDAQSPGTDIQNNISVTITDLQPGTEVRVYPEESPINTTEIAGIESTGSPSEFTFSGPAGLVVNIVIFHLDYVLPPDNRLQLTIPSADTAFPVSQIIDRNYLNP